jgi:hypothetical protein
VIVYGSHIRRFTVYYAYHKQWSHTFVVYEYRNNTVAVNNAQITS